MDTNIQPAPVAAVHLAWSYQRTSTTRQAHEDRSGMGRQEEALARWLADHPEYQLQDSLVDAGVSASTGANRKKGALGRFIAAAEAGHVPPGSVLIVESLTRFSREEELDVVETLLSQFWNRGLGLAVVAHNCIYSRELMRAEAHRMHMLWGSLSQARAEADEKSRRATGAARKRQQLQDAGEKIASATPWWIQRNSETKQLVRDANGNMLIDPISQQTINRAVELAIGGMGSTLIAQTLNDEQHPLPPTSANGNQYGPRASAAWSHSRVAYLLRHPALLGDMVRRDGQTLAGFYPPAITVEKWHELRGSVDARGSLKGSLRGGGQQVRNLFMGLTRCGVCGGPFSFQSASARAHPEHPGYMNCRAANRRINPTCSNPGYLNYRDVESHCLTRLTADLWQQLLGTPDQDQEVDALQQQVDQLGHDRRAVEAQLEQAEQRLQELWASEASELRQEMAEKAVAKLRLQLAAIVTSHDKATGDLQLLKSRPSGTEAAAEMNRQVSDFWRRLDAGKVEPPERRTFNRWLRCRQPTIEFHFHPAEAADGQPTVELMVGGVSAGIEPLAPELRGLARVLGAVDPIVHERNRPDGVLFTVVSSNVPREVARILLEVQAEFEAKG
jgi:hypothetical protein